jgi:heme/copper-type cytochrome/quinol oxidase subunit 2
MSKKVLVLAAIVFSALLQTASANPYWAHDEPHEQLADAFYYSGPLGLIFTVIVFVMVVVGVVWSVYYWHSYGKFKDVKDA